jgi:hypothetical protein
MTAMDRDVRVGCFTLAFGLYIGWTSFTMPSRGGLIESPGIFPGLMGILLLIFGFVLTFRSLKKGGRFRLDKLFSSVIPILKSETHRPVLLGILLPAVYVFVCIPLIGFYISSALFMTIMFYLFVKGWRRWCLFLPIAVGITGLLYATFNILFQLQIW